MNPSFDKLMFKLPQDICNDIFKFILPDQHQIEFRLDEGYSKHKVAFLNNNILLNKRLHLFIIERKNGKKRYYISEKVFNYAFCVNCGSDGYCDCDTGYYDYKYSFKSSFIGSNLNKAILELYIR